MSSRGAYAALALALVALFVHARAYDFVSDDTFINLRYCQNLLAGHGLVFNPGERVEAYSSLPLVLLASLAGWLGLDLLAAVRWLGCAAALACVAYAFALVRPLAPGAPRALGLAASCLVAASAPFACWALGGMDAPLFACALLFALHGAWRLATGRGPRLALGAAVLLALTRPEGPLLAAVLLALGLWWSAAKPARALACLGGLALGVGALLVFRLAYYGEWLPNTYYAKVGAPSWTLVERGIEYLADYARDHGGAALLGAPLFAAWWRRDAAWWLTTAAFGALLACVVLEGGDGLPMYRFLVPAVPLWALLAASLLGDAIARVGAGWRGVPWWCVAAALAASLAWPRADSVHYLRYRGHRDFEIEAWTAAGVWLAGHAPAGASVACVPIGAVAYYSGLPVIDMVGLTDPHIARVALPTGSGWAGHEKRDGKYVLARRPTFLLLGNVRVLDQALPIDHPEFVRIRHPAIEAREGDIYGSELVRHYQPQVANLGAGLFLHYLRRHD